MPGPGPLPPLEIALFARVIGAALALVLAWAAARRVLGRGGAPLDRDDGRLGAATLVAFAVSASGLALGSFGALRLETWLGLLAAVSLAAFTRPAAEEPARTEPGPRPPSPTFAIVLGGLLAAQALFSLRNPATDRDTLEYHVPMFAHWLESGSLGVALHHPAKYVTHFPGGAELLQLFASWPFPHAAAVTWPTLLALGAAALAARRVAIELGARAGIAEALTLAALASPGVLAAGRTTQADAFVAAWALVALRFLLRARASGAPRDVAVAFAALGLLAATRFNAPALACVLLALAAVLPPGLPRRAFTPGVLAVGALAAAVGLFWLVRNGVTTGNPLYPATLTIAGRTLPGLLDGGFVHATSQLAVWSQGRAGNFTLTNVMRYYGPALALVVAGTLLAPLGPRGARAAASGGRRLLGACALAALVLTLASSFSGANAPAGPGRALVIVPSNVRYALPVVALLLPLAGAGFSGTAPIGRLVVLVASALVGWRLAAAPGRFAIGLLIAGAALALGRLVPAAITRPPFARAAAAACVAVLLALAVRAVSPAYAQRWGAAWDARRGTEDVQEPESALVARVRAAAAGRPVACVGPRSVGIVTGPDFSGRPIYLPVSHVGSAEPGTWRFATDDRSHPDRAAWLANLERERPAFVLIYERRAEPNPIERTWCAGDTTRFTPWARGERCEVYAVR